MRRRAARAAVAGRRAARATRLLAGGTPHIHVVVEKPWRPALWSFFDWLERRHPGISRRVRISGTEERRACLPGSSALLLPRVQDPVRERSPRLYERLRVVEKRHRDAGVPVVNPVASLSNSIKSRALPVIASVGARTARAHQIDPRTRFDEVATAMGLPFIVREDSRHGGSIVRIANEEEYAALDWSLIADPVALEFVDTRSRDGLYRKYRYLMTGNEGVARHLVITPAWCVHAQDRIRTDDALREELDFLDRPNSHHDVLDRARRALGMDFVAFDYSMTAEGELVVWEPNPFPCLWGGFNQADPYFAYQKPWMERVHSQILRFYQRYARPGFA